MTDYHLNTYRLPAEWEPHKATWLNWPHNPNTWDMEELVAIYPAYVEFAKRLSYFEEVHININRDLTKEMAHNMLQMAGAKMENVYFHYFPTNDAWIRDCGPDFLVNIIDGSKLVVNWGYNAWGGKYPPFDLDNKLPIQIANFRGYDHVTPDMILEGGSFDVNGVGDLITTKQCLFNTNRNPLFSPTKIEHHLEHHFSVDNIIWLNEGLVGDDTDGHVDDIARFVNPDTILAVVETNNFDPNYKTTQDNLKILKQSRLANGKQPNIIEIELPSIKKHNDIVLPCSYANFYIANNQVIVPVFDDPMDEPAIQQFESVFKDREVVPIQSKEILVGLGSFHCLSKQEPL